MVFLGGFCKVKNQLELSRVYDKIALVWWTQQSNGFRMSFDDCALSFDV